MTINYNEASKARTISLIAQWQAALNLKNQVHLKHAGTFVQYKNIMSPHFKSPSPSQASSFTIILKFMNFSYFAAL